MPEAQRTQGIESILTPRTPGSGKKLDNMITLWASICWSSHARVTSKKSLFSLKSWNAELNLFSKSFHRRQNFCAGAIFRFIFHIQILQSIKSIQASNGNSEPFLKVLFSFLSADLLSFSHHVLILLMRKHRCAESERYPSSSSSSSPDHCKTIYQKVCASFIFNHLLNHKCSCTQPSSAVPS